MNITELIENFSQADNEMRLEMLVEFSEMQPELDEKHKAEQVAGLYAVPECQTPVYLKLEVNNNILNIYSDVAKESPTVRGFVTALVSALNGSPVTDAISLPQDILVKMGLLQTLSSLRTRGLEAVVYRIRKQAQQFV
jgi:cysteine desulfuration protein SufE